MQRVEVDAGQLLTFLNLQPNGWKHLGFEPPKFRSRKIELMQVIDRERLCLNDALVDLNQIRERICIDNSLSVKPFGKRKSHDKACFAQSFPTAHKGESQ